jgi:hypothetical protein
MDTFKKCELLLSGDDALDVFMHRCWEYELDPARELFIMMENWLSFDDQRINNLKRNVDKYEDALETAKEHLIAVAKSAADRPFSAGGPELLGILEAVIEVRKAESRLAEARKRNDASMKRPHNNKVGTL